MKETIIKIRIWFGAHFQDFPYWRIIYADGQRSYLLHYGEAKGISEVYSGKLIIDYKECRKYFV